MRELFILTHLYGIKRDDVAYIMETFPIVKKRDIQQYGSYKTKETILKIYDAMAECIKNGASYESPLDPPPGYAIELPELPPLVDYVAPEVVTRARPATRKKSSLQTATTTAAPQASLFEQATVPVASAPITDSGPLTLSQLKAGLPRDFFELNGGGRLWLASRAQSEVVHQGDWVVFVDLAKPQTAREVGFGVVTHVIVTGSIDSSSQSRRSWLVDAGGSKLMYAIDDGDRCRTEIALLKEKK